MRQCKNVPGEEQMKTIIYRFWQCTWGVLQTAAGFSVFLANIKKRHFCYRGAVVTEWDKKAGLSLGMFVFIGKGSLNAAASADSLFSGKYLTEREISDGHDPRMLVHEYGHTLQSLLLGPLYLIVIGLPSLMWFSVPICVKYRKKNGISYFSFYTERWADRMGNKVVKKAETGSFRGTGSN